MSKQKHKVKVLQHAKLEYRGYTITGPYPEHKCRYDALGPDGKTGFRASLAALLQVIDRQCRDNAKETK